MKKFLVVLICSLAALFLSTDTRTFRKNLSNDVFRTDVFGVSNKPSMVVSSEEANITKPTWCEDCITSSGSLSDIKQNVTWSVQAVRNGKMIIRLMGPDVRLDNRRIPVYVVYKNLVVDGALVLAEPVIVSHDKPYKYTMDMKAGQKVEFSVMPEKAGVLDYWKTLHVKWYMFALYFVCFVGIFAILKKLLKKKSK